MFAVAIDDEVQPTLPVVPMLSVICIRPNAEGELSAARSVANKIAPLLHEHALLTGFVAIQLHHHCNSFVILQAAHLCSNLWVCKRIGNL